MNEQQHIISRNKIITLVIWGSFLFSLISSLFTKTSSLVITMSLVIGIPLLILVSLIAFKGKFPYFMMYTNMTLMTAFIWALVLIEPHIVNFLGFFFVLVLSTLYQYKKLVYYMATFIILLTAEVYYVSGNRDLIFASSTSTDYIFIFGVFLFISLVLIAQTHHSHKVQNEIVNEKQKAEELAKENKQSLIKMTKNAKAVSAFSRNLTDTIEHTKKLSDETTVSVGEMSRGFMIQSDAMSEIEQTVQRVDDTIGTVSSATEEMLSSSQRTMDSTEQGNQELGHLEVEMAKVNAIIGDSVTTMKDLVSSTNQIMDITQLINEISNQINLLSLNASIEAARAGEHGKGFAVVASEVKKLADGSKNSIEDIQKIIEELKHKTNLAFNRSSQGKEAMNISDEALEKVKTTFQDITDNTNVVLNMSKEIQELVQSLNTSSTVIVDRVVNSSAISQQNSSAVQDVLKNIEEQNEQLHVIVEKLQTLENQVRKF